MGTSLHILFSFCCSNHYISNACSSKLKCSSESSCRVYSFLPVDQLPSKTPHKYDAFFAPLIEEIENLYLDGKCVFFRSAVSGYSTENSRLNVHVVPQLLTEDMKARAEIYLTCAGSGKKGCRGCEGWRCLHSQQASLLLLRFF